MTKKILILFSTLALAVASAGTHSLTLFQSSVVAGKELKPGEYKLSLEGTKVVISKGKEKVETEAKLQSADSKFSSTSVRYVTDGGKNMVREIRLGGTTTRLVFN
jgi:hypothetical protein